MSCDPTANGFQITQNYVLGPGGEELTMLDGSNNWQRTNVYAGGKLIGTYDSAGLHFHIEDPLGTRRMQLSGNPNFVGQPETDIQSLPYGDDLFPFPDANAPSTADDATPLHFTGKERDSESGNDYFGDRYFASSMGRWLSPDYQDMSDDDVPEAVPNGALSNPQTLNLYSYVLNNPLNRRDYDGHAGWGPCASDANSQCWNGDYNGERDCSGNSGGCLFWNSQTNQWQGTDPTAKPDPGLADLPGIAFTGLTRLMLGDRYGSQQVGYAYARVFASAIGAGGLVPKPRGTPLGPPPIVPKGWIEQPSKKGGGTVYVDPNNPHNRVRVMPGNPDSPNPAQREPYMKVQVSGQFIDANGNQVEGSDPGAHIPVDTPMESPFM